MICAPGTLKEILIFLDEGFTANLLSQSSVTKHRGHLRGWEDQMLTNGKWHQMRR